MTRGFSAAILGVPLPGSEEAQSNNDREPMVGSSTAGMNRDRVQENQRMIAAQLLTYSVPVMACIAIIILALTIAGFVIYVQGWVVWSNSYKKPCDQPLQWWLLVMLFVPMLHCGISQNQDQRPGMIKALAMPIGIAVGSWMWMRCQTCVKTNPELFFYTKKFLIYQFAVWVSMVFMSCGLVWGIFWLYRNGLLESGPGPHAAARPGLIEEIETVPFNPVDHSETSNELEPPECPICFEEFQDGEPIKRTPCRHLFHEQCLGKWLTDYGKLCPLCRENLEETVDNHECEP